MPLLTRITDTSHVISDRKNSNRINERSNNLFKAWNKKYFNNDLFDAALEWLCADENYPDNANLASQRIDSIMQQACDLAMPRIKRKTGQSKSSILVE